MSRHFTRAETHFQLFGDPFAGPIEAKSLFRHPAFAAAFDALYLHVLKRKGLALLIGEAGVGKTALLGRLLERLRDQAFISDRVVSPGLYPRVRNDPAKLAVSGLMTLLRVSNNGSNPHRSREDRPQTEEQLEVLTEALTALAHRRVTVVLLIDDAQKLTEAAVRNLHILSALRDGRYPLLQVVLAGTPDLQERLELAEDCLAPPIIATRIRLTGLDRREVGPYVEHRARLAARPGGGLFTPEAVERIAAFSGGVPLRINQIASAALHIASARSSDTVSAEAVDKAAEDCARQAAAPADRLADRPPQAAVTLIQRTLMGRSARAARADGDRPVAVRRQGGRRGRIAALSAFGVGSAVAAIVVAAYWGTAGLRGDVGPGQLAGTGAEAPAREMPGVPARPSARSDAPAAGAPLSPPAEAAASIERPVEMPDLPLGKDGPIPAQVREPVSVASGPAAGERRPEPEGEDLSGEDLTGKEQELLAPLPEARTSPAAVLAAQAEPTGFSPEPPAKPEPRAEDIGRPTADSTPAPAPQAGGSAGDEAPEAAGETQTPPVPALAAAPAADPETPPPATEVPPPADVAAAPEQSAMTVTASPEMSPPPRTPAPSAPPTETVVPASAGIIRSGAAGPRPAAPAAEAPALQRMIARGDALLSTGDVVSARLFYELAASLGSPAAATMVGKTYDPFFLIEAGIHGAQADIGKAAEWYSRAIERGDSDASARLQQLNRRHRQ